MSGKAVTDPPPQDATEAMMDKAADAWLTAFFASPAGMRANAQVGYTIAAAVAGAVIGAGLIADVPAAPVWVQIPAGISLALWLYAAWKFIRAVAAQPKLGGLAHEQGPGTLAEQAIQRVWQDRERIAERSWAAQHAAFGAGLLTLITIVAVMLAPSFAVTTATVLLTDDGLEHLGAHCTVNDAKLTAGVDLGALDEDTVILRDVDCHGTTTLRLRKGDIAGVLGGNPDTFHKPD